MPEYVSERWQCACGNNCKSRYTFDWQGDTGAITISPPPESPATRLMVVVSIEQAREIQKILALVLPKENADDTD